jgi:hypothetical protein
MSQRAVSENDTPANTLIPSVINTPVQHNPSPENEKAQEV